ncbi:MULTISPECIES: hypothetical protein [unclassified Sedimentibacter]|uniref:hypothetical protein n=1 Tax=unclassified Sedimentibacter TaxID=2649220 RepID=UPI0027DF68FD|nr:hypothetical protein [Sedimentibacter sp. MB35-C1]WMJ77726.1 hypothetical protein RBQ61_02015 [Sedimentibacter sp. MB35-C1]
MSEKNKLIISKVIIVFLVLIYLISVYQLHKAEPIKHIHGTYQSVDAPEVYTFTFSSYDGTYLINYVYETLEEGTFEKYGYNTYICKDKSGKKSLLTLLHDGFFYYDCKNDRIVKAIKKSDVPTVIFIDENTRR